MNEIWSLLVAQGMLGVMQTCFQILTNPRTYSVCGHISDKLSEPQLCLYL